MIIHTARGRQLVGAVKDNVVVRVYATAHKLVNLVATRTQLTQEVRQCVGRQTSYTNIVREENSDAENIVISLNTNNTDDKIPEMIDIFDALTDDLATYGIEFTYKFEADHDRAIILNNGWTINLNRGLDIFEKFDRFSIAAARQTERRCREFNMTVNETSNVRYLD